jgi:hypothetical protein
MNYNLLILPIALSFPGSHPANALSAPVTSISRETHNKNGGLTFLHYYQPMKTAPQLVKLDIIEKIKSFQSLDNNWDGYGAAVPDSRVVSNSIAFLNSLPQSIVSDINKDNLVPTPYGTVVIDLAFNKELVSIEIGETKIGFFSEFEDGNDIKLEGTLFNQDNLPLELLQAIKRLYKEVVA